MENYELASKGITIYFSKNRPLQLDLALKTNEYSSVDWTFQREVVIYKATNKRFQKAYEEIAKEHPFTTFIEETDFKSDLLNFLTDMKYVMFVVDDCVFTADYSLVEICTKLEEHPNTIGFSLRLGRNTKYCYPLSVENSIPATRKIKDSKMLKFNWETSGIGDFSYPLEVSSSVYRVQDLMLLLNSCSYNDPNSLESALYCNLGLFNKSSFLMSYQTSVAFCNPVNKVQTVNNNRAGSHWEYSIESLLEKFERGYRIVDKNFYGFVSNGCHQEVDFHFTPKGKS